MASVSQTGRIALAGIASVPRSHSQQSARRARPCVRSAALKQPPAGVQDDKVEVSVSPAAAPASSSKAPPPNINVIPENGVWENGIPPVMGAHLMASGIVAPISTSVGVGTGPKHVFQYREEEGEGTILQYGNPAQVSVGLAKAIEKASAEAIAEKGSFTLVLSGGSLPSLLDSVIGNASIEFDKWTVMFVDERNVPHSSADSNYTAAMDAFLSKVGVPDSQIIKITQGLSAEQAATAYAGEMMALPATVLPRNEDGYPITDMMLLGIGQDGHVASLFPNKAQTCNADGSWVLPVTTSPKPPAERITMTMPVINAAKEVFIVATGESKAEIVQRALETQTLPGALPAQLVAPASGKLTWMVDAEACSMLQPLDWETAKMWPRSEV